MPYELFGKVDPVYNIENYAKEVRFILQKSHIRASEILRQYKTKMKETYDRQTRPIDVKVGDRIKIRDETGHKLDPIYEGPVEIKAIDRENVEI